ncbi:hypothetical protein ACH5RR_011894 [Cinchona calisaya]|uniref:Gag-pol polyprotein n=1 Tax=Cinchona calisaya TaxID=153742 RepID=A0ABD3AC41_9GENT
MNDSDVPAPTRINPLMLAKVNGMDILAMVDTGATHSFVTGREVRRLKLELKEHGYRIKAVKSEAQPVQGAVVVGKK